MEEERNTKLVYARIAGLSYIVFTVAGLLKNFLLNTRLSDISDIQSEGVFVTEMHFRFGIAAEVLLFLAVLMASVAFYVVLRSINKPLAQLALCLRLCEVVLGGMAVIASMAMLALSTKASYAAIFDLEQLRTIVAIVSSLRMPAYEYSWIFMGFAGVITFYLFFKSRYIPRFWSVWGLVTYTSLILYPIAKVLVPDLPRQAMVVLYPGALFELGVGLWLLVVGIKISGSSNTSSDKAS